MLKNWQFNVLFFVGVGGAVLLLIGPDLGLEVSENPTALTGIGAILTYVLTQRKSLTKHEEEKPEEDTKKAKLKSEPNPAPKSEGEEDKNAP